MSLEEHANRELAHRSQSTTRNEDQRDRDKSLDWPDPKLLQPDLLPVDLFSMDYIAPQLRRYVSDTAERMQCAPDFIVAAAIVGLGSLIGSRRRIAPKAKDDWKVTPNLYGAIIGRPGLLKSPALMEALAPIRHLEREASKKFDKKERAYQRDLVVFKAKEKKKIGEIAKYIRTGSEEVARDIAETMLDDRPKKPIAGRYITNDTTIEKLGEILSENPQGILIVRDELIGFLRQMDKAGRESDRSFYLEAWNGNTDFTYDRIGRGTVRIKAAIVSVIGGIQPGPLSAYLVEADRGDVGADGLLQRFQLMVWPDAPGAYKNIDRAPDDNVRMEYMEVCMRLAHMTLCKEPVHFSENAQRIFNKWRQELEERLLAGEETEALESHLAKYRSLVPSLALIDQLVVKSDATFVASDSLQRAIALTMYLESHARRVYGARILNDVKGAKRILRAIRKKELNERFSTREVYRNHWASLKDSASAEAALSVLEDAHYIRQDTVKTGGRPSIVWNVNPRYLTKYVDTNS